ncbi:VOC family protein [Algoriphagus sediminis]|uniref:VOC family protein n=1 Tax=Algoriphagus sediminis TaxID=3057113 RepID=A0ABT7YH61_9BACT|nr:VOC family protein [Algoriphagus sediminis]MDN3205863.1 VOC family protein [Algoriphagus sediminis]
MQKHVFTSFVLILFLTQSHAQIKVNHIAVHVSDLEASMAFYDEILKLQEIEEPFKDGLHAWYDIGGGAALHLIESAERPEDLSKVNHLCFSMQDMDTFIESLNSTKYPFESWEGEKGKITNRVDGVQQIYIQDPDGYWLEINDDY